MTYSSHFSNLRARRPRGPSLKVHIVKRFSTAMAIEQYIAVNDLAEYEGRSMAAIVRMALDDYLRIHRVPKP